MLSPKERTAWLAERKKGIGGSDAAAILGYSPWKTAMDVWLDKMGMVPERPDPDREFLLDLGERLEPVIAALYEKQTGRAITKPLTPIFQHPEHTFLIGTPDRIGAGATDTFGVELKTENEFTDRFGNPGSDEVPAHYFIQCAHYMAITGFDRWDVAVLHGGSRFNVYTLNRDKELEAVMIERLREWWDRHVLGRIPPDVDSSDAWRRYLHARHPVETLPLTQIPPDKARLVATLAAVHRAEKTLGALRDETENQLKQVIGEREGVTSDFGRVTWKKIKDSTAINWKGAYEAMARKYNTPAEMQLEILKPFEVIKPGVRRFLFTAPKGTHGHQLGNDKTKLAAALGIDGEPDDDTPGDGERGTRGTSQSTN